MKLPLIESVADILALVGSAIGSVVLALVGLLADQAGIRNVLTGHLALGMWELWMGTLAVVVGVYLLGYRQFWQRFHALRHAE